MIMWITFFIAIIALALFVLGLSITLIRKGRNIQSDVGSNDEMKRRGVACTIEQMGGTSCASSCATDGTPPLCGDCSKSDSCDMQGVQK